MRAFERHLTTLLEDLSGQQSVAEVEKLSEEYLQIVNKIGMIKTELEDLYNKMVSIESKTMAAMTTAIKSHEPNADLNLQSGALHIGDVDEVAVVKPENGQITVQGMMPFAGPATNALMHILKHILPECRHQTGKLYVEGRRCSSLALYNYKEQL